LRVNGEIELLQGSFTSRSFKPHFHETYALILVENGIADYSYKQNEYVVKTNKLLILNPYEVHTGRSLGAGLWNFRSMYIPQDIIRNNCDVSSNKTPQFLKRIVDHQDLISRYQHLHDQLLNGDMTIDQESELSLWLSELGQIAGINTSYLIKDKHSAIAAKMKDYIHEYFDDNIQLDDLMNITGLSRFHLIKVFSDKYGLPPHQYLNNLRIEKAKSLLTQGLQSTDVAFTVGYFDQSHFIRHFKKIVGVTPKAYVKG
jgi:AraC-like DNA-binding protein